ncbi:MAG: PfkB family carbohydrate kinase [Oscillospiraceae bacterium]
MSKDKLVVSGYSGVNYFIKVDKIPEIGVTQIVRNKDNSKCYYGGNGINITYYLAKLGLNTMPILRGGNDFDKLGIKDFLIKNNISLNGVSYVKDDLSAICYMIEDASNEHMVLFYPGAMNEKYACVDCVKDVFANAKFFVMSVASAKDNRLMLAEAKKCGIPLVFSMKNDPDGFPDDLLFDSLCYAQIIFMNDREEKQLIEKFKLNSISDFSINGNASLIVVTRGKNGCKVLEKKAEGIHTDDVKATTGYKVVDTAGAGDAFLAGFMYGILKGKDAIQSAELGSTMSSFIIEDYGCMTNVPNETKLLQRNETRG